ncbi:hypothetical protein Tco_0057664 [Tanacetum coccineum]
MFDTMGMEIDGLRTRIDITLLEDRQRRWMSDSQNSLTEFYKTDVITMSASLTMNLKELKEEFIEEVQEMLNIFESMDQKVDGKSSKENFLQNEIDGLLEVSLTSEIRDCALLSVEKQKNELLKDELTKSSSDFKDIQANLLKRIKILENDFNRSQAQSIDFELKLQHQKEKMACDVSWKSKLSTLNDENVLLKTQVESVVEERENIKLEFQKLFNSIKLGKVVEEGENEYPWGNWVYRVKGWWRSLGLAACASFGEQKRNNLSHRNAFGNGEGLPTWHLYNWGGSRVDEMILARERSGFAGEKYGTIVQVVTGFWGGKEDFLGELAAWSPQVI